MRIFEYALRNRLFMSCIILQILVTLVHSRDEHRIRRNRSYSRRLSWQNQETTSTDPIGERNCTDEEERRQGCLAGKCIAKVQSHYHTFIICSCPSNRRGARCEESNIDIEVMAEELKKLEPDTLCKQERYDILAKSVGYESRFIDCVEKNYPNLKKETREQRRERKRRERERKRKRKMRRRQRKRKQKKKLRSLKNRPTSQQNTLDINSQNNDGSDISKLLKLLSAKEHKIRHKSEKKKRRRRQQNQQQQQPMTLYLSGSPTTASTLSSILIS